MLFRLFGFIGAMLFLISPGLRSQTVIRYNQLGYTPSDIKMVVAASKDPSFRLLRYQLQRINTGQTVFSIRNAGERDFGKYGPFEHTYRINLSAVVQPGIYRLVVNDNIVSDTIRIAHDVYKGTADFCLQFLRGQRCNINSYTHDTCHKTGDYAVGGSLPDSTVLNVQGGWHNSANNTQEIEKAASVTCYLLSAYQHFPGLFNDNSEANGSSGKNDRPDVLDEAKWGLDWMIKMHPFKDQLYRQVGQSASENPEAKNSADDALGRPVFAVYDSLNNLPNGYKSTGQIAAIVSSAFSLGSMMTNKFDVNFANRLTERAVNTFELAMRTKTNPAINPPMAPLLALAAANLYQVKPDKKYLEEANSYNPFLKQTAAGSSGNSFLLENTYISNVSENNLLQQTCAVDKANLQKITQLAAKNAFLHGLPFTEGSNKLAVAVALKCLSVSHACGDSSFAALAQANLDWLFGCNLWGISMIAGLPGGKSTANPFNLHSADFSTGGLVNGPVSEILYRNSKGNSLLKKDSFANWQSSLAVYHDDLADYTTNQSTLEGTAALIYLLAAKENAALAGEPNGFQFSEGAITRGDSAKKRIALVFIADKNGPGGKTIPKILSKEKTHASFFLTTDLARSNPALVRQLKGGGHYIGAYGSTSMANCEKAACDSFFMSKSIFNSILQQNFLALKPYGITATQAPVILPSSERYNKYISEHTYELGLKIINRTNGTLSTEDISLPHQPGYCSSDSIFLSVMAKARQKPYGLNGYFLVFHTDAEPARTDKFYMLLPLLLQELKGEGYDLIRVDEMLGLRKPILAKSISSHKSTKGKKPKQKAHRR